MLFEAEMCEHKMICDGALKLWSCFIPCCGPRSLISLSSRLCSCSGKRVVCVACARPAASALLCLTLSFSLCTTLICLYTITRHPFLTRCSPQARHDCDGIYVYQVVDTRVSFIQVRVCVCVCVCVCRTERLGGRGWTEETLCRVSWSRRWELLHLHQLHTQCEHIHTVQTLRADSRTRTPLA